ncbi:MAG: uroporphyrinogen-III synthase [Caldilineales bacterium]
MTPASNLTGKRVVVTRAAEQAGDLEDLLRSRGALPLPYPCIAIAAPEDTGDLDEALRVLAAGGYDWLVLTSRNAVAILAERLDALGLTPLAGGTVKVAAVGAATGAAIEAELGVRVDLLPDEFVAEALAEALLAQLPPGGRVLLCQADIARPVLADTLAAGGVAVTPVVAYRTVPGSGGVSLPDLLRAGQVDAITFTSSSTVRNLLARLDAEGGCRADLAGVCLACIGPVTADTAAKLGLAVQVVPAEHTITALVDALEAYFANGA